MNTHDIEHVKFFVYQFVPVMTNNALSSQYFVVALASLLHYLVELLHDN